MTAASKDERMMMNRLDDAPLERMRAVCVHFYDELGGRFCRKEGYELSIYLTNKKREMIGCCRWA